MKKKFLVFLFLLTLALASYPVDTLAARGFRNGGIRHVWRVCDGDFAVFSYIHSVSKTPIEETLMISKGKIELVKVSYTDQGGAGMPEFEWGSEQFKLEDGKFVLEGFDRSFEKINITVQRAYEDTLSVNGRTTELIKIAGEGENISIGCERKMAAAYALEKIASILNTL